MTASVLGCSGAAASAHCANAIRSQGGRRLARVSSATAPHGKQGIIPLSPVAQRRRALLRTALLLAAWTTASRVMLGLCRRKTTAWLYPCRPSNLVKTKRRLHPVVAAARAHRSWTLHRHTATSTTEKEEGIFFIRQLRCRGPHWDSNPWPCAQHTLLAGHSVLPLCCTAFAVSGCSFLSLPCPMASYSFLFLFLFAPVPVYLTDLVNN